jgi:hypothetical protein
LAAATGATRVSASTATTSLNKILNRQVCANLANRKGTTARKSVNIPSPTARNNLSNCSTRGNSCTKTTVLGNGINLTQGATIRAERKFRPHRQTTLNVPVVPRHKSPTRR